MKSTKSKSKRFLVRLLTLLLVLFVTLSILPSNIVQIIHTLMGSEFGLAIYWALLFALLIEYVDTLRRETTKERTRGTLIAILINEIDNFRNNIDRILSTIMMKETSLSTSQAAANRILVETMMRKLLDESSLVIRRIEDDALREGIALADIAEYKTLLDMHAKINWAFSEHDINNRIPILRKVANAI